MINDWTVNEIVAKLTEMDPNEIILPAFLREMRLSAIINAARKRCRILRSPVENAQMGRSSYRRPFCFFFSTSTPGK